jgi:hypothetical protein
MVFAYFAVHLSRLSQLHFTPGKAMNFFAFA